MGARVEMIPPKILWFEYSSLLIQMETALILHRLLGSSERRKAAQYTEGGPENLFIGQVAQPEPKDGEVRIKVMFTAINRADTLQRRGGYNPPPGASDILGLEAAGVIEKIGPGCPTNVTTGQRVMALLSGGGNAEYVTCPWQLAMEVPGHFSMSQAAAVPEVWLTAYMLLYTLGQLKKEDTVLIHAGGSGVGTAAVQLVHQCGATAIVTAGSQEKIDLAKSLGASAGINYKQEAVGDRVLEITNGKGADMILDCVGASMQEENTKALALEGRWIVYGLMGGASTNVNLGVLLRKRANLMFSTLRARSLEYKAVLVKNFSELALPLFDNGTFKPIVQAILPLADIGKAHAMMEANQTQGKLVLQVHGDEAAKEEL
ncbi:tumor protein p53 inducible protein 3 [Plakobranchus ocellatus]|uniref:Tumor protein p53 inducible protein 3 n=1 Tax=Plakobranchus ocellatus TaxID=259542 RepID=A0AAV4DHE1_9GAST|nr:tumor protein p53 inducible protein 3 [Plakobranchus ocellatus]